MNNKMKEVFRLEEVVRLAVEKINKIYLNEAITFEKILNVTFTEKMRKGYGAYYNIPSKKIFLNEKYFGVSDNDIDKVTGYLIHEIGHKIHFEIYNNRRYNFPTKDKSYYACRNYNENFAEAFVDLIERGKVVTERDQKMFKILAETNSRTSAKEEEVAAIVNEEVAAIVNEEVKITSRSIIVLNSNFDIVEILENQKALGEKYNPLGLGGRNLVPCLRELKDFQPKMKRDILKDYLGWYFVTYKDLEEFENKYQTKIQF